MELNAGMRIEGLGEAFEVPHRDGAFLAGMEISTWRSPMGDVDVLQGLPSPHGEVRYDDLLDRADTFRIDGQAVKVASLDDVIVSKQTNFANCSSRSSACWRWLSANAATYGYKNLPSEAWHWSTTGR